MSTARKDLGEEKPHLPGTVSQQQQDKSHNTHCRAPCQETEYGLLWSLALVLWHQGFETGADHCRLVICFLSSAGACLQWVVRCICIKLVPVLRYRYATER